MKVTQAFLLFSFYALSACQPLDPCLKTDEFNVKLGDTVFIKSCAENTEIYAWNVEGEAVNDFLNPPQPFYTHFADSGGGSCDPFVYLIFYDTGNYRVQCVNGKLSNGNCSDDFAFKKSESAFANVHVRDTVHKPKTP
jgi:hypothetical protein